MNMAGWGGLSTSVPQAGIPPRGQDPEDEEDGDLEDEEDLDWDQAQVCSSLIGARASGSGGGGGHIDRALTDALFASRFRQC